MPPTKRQWAFSLLWINLAVLVALLFAMAMDQSLGFRGLLHIAAYSLFYANVTGILGIYVLGALAPRLAGRKLPGAPTFIAGITLCTALGFLLAQALWMKITQGSLAQFWPEYFHALRIAMPLAIIFGLGAFAHASLQSRAQAMEERLREKEVAEERARKLAVEARLQSLESRLRPHFLFNTLNSISALIALNPARAEQIVGRLASLLRASLDTSNQTLIPLRDELAMVESYADIEKARFGDKLRSSIQVPHEFLCAKVPPMALLSLVENAVKHGVTSQGGKGEVVVTAAAENDSLRIEVQDTGPGFDLAAIPAGHGLENLVDRLGALFGAKARLNVLRRDGYTVVEMVVPRV